MPTFADLPRSAGVQLHITSLPDGRLGAEARRFVDWLAAAGQTWWQMLPVGPPDRHGSPYKSRSAFAAWRGFLADPRAPVSAGERDAFRAANAEWIGDWERVAGARGVADQVRFEREWSALRAYAADRGVRLMGDVPIYVAPGSADHIAHPELFQTGVVAGVPPDAYSDRGQLWGNPLFDWPALSAQRYRWWVARLRRTFSLFDLARVDHFRGFAAYWAVPSGASDARGGSWRRGPGAAPFRAAQRALGPLAVVAEDLGEITPSVVALRRSLGFPGMVVLQFAFSEHDADNVHEPANHEDLSVCYTGTHDNDTARGWWESLPQERRAIARAAGLSARSVWWSLVELAHASPARLAMIQAQDVLGLPSCARMNQPGRAAGAWKWRLQRGQLTAAHARRLRAITAAGGRLP